MLSRFELIAYRSWYGPLRRPVRAMARRLTDESSRIVWGPLKGLRFTGQELVCRIGIYELHVQYGLKELLQTGDVFYDAGAHNGYLSLLGAQCVKPAGMVYAFEPLERNARRIQTLMAENEMANYQLVSKAVSNQSGATEFYLGDESDTYTSSLIRGRRSRAALVETTTLDAFAAENRWPDLIKMDIEGAEATALEGAATLLASSKAPKWLIELHSSETDWRVRKILLDHGYGVRILPTPFPKKPYPSHIIATKERFK
jgi:FkbM family methyltransferase